MKNNSTNTKENSSDSREDLSYKKHGVRHPMQVSRIFENNMKSRSKDFITDSGIVIKYQGYENVLIKFLIEETEIKDTEIITDVKEIPSVFYKHPDTLKESRYYSDIWIKRLNLLIEIKSTFMYRAEKELTDLKHATSKSLGYNHMIVICNKSKILNVIL